MFHEKLIVENIVDPENHQTVSVKAIIKKQDNFSLQVAELSFGPCLVNSECLKTCSIVLSNTNNKLSRVFEVRADMKQLEFKRCRAELKFSIQENDMNLASPIVNTVMLTKVCNPFYIQGT